MRQLSMDSLSEQEAMSRSDSGKQPLFMPDDSPAFSTNPSNVEYTCHDCGEVIARVFPNFYLIATVQCPDCKSYNEFPHSP